MYKRIYNTNYICVNESNYTNSHTFSFPNVLEYGFFLIDDDMQSVDTLIQILHFAVYIYNYLLKVLNILHLIVDILYIIKNLNDRLYNQSTCTLDITGIEFESFSNLKKFFLKSKISIKGRQKFCGPPLKKLLFN